MSVEYWGTFSVHDHLTPRAFVADVLLYDRLLIPTLPEGDPVGTWQAEWDLARQRKLLAHLGHFAIPIPWTADRRAQFEKRYEGEQSRYARAEVTQLVEGDAALVRDFARQYPDAPYATTRNILMDFVNQEADNLLFQRLKVQKGALPGSTVRAFTAYPSYAGFAADQPTAETPEPSPGAAFGWQFFVPESAKAGPDEDRRLLDKAMKLAGKAEFIEQRRDFYTLWEDIKNARYSPEDAKALMETRLAAYRRHIAGERWKKRACYAMCVAPLLIPVFGAAAATFVGASALAVQWFSAGANLFVGGAAIPAKEKLAPSAAPPQMAAAAMFHDARRHLGWRSR
jgi:hypothetical protein